MDKIESKELLDKILAVENDPKGARVASTVFINKAEKEDAAVLLEYLDHHNAAVLKIVRHILGQVGVTEAVQPLIDEFLGVVENLNFMPDEEYKESQYYPNIIDILETLFAIVKSEGITHDAFSVKVEDIFKHTKNEDLRFTLIKLVAILGDRLDYFIGIYDDLTEKERRALYYVYTVVEHPKRVEIYKKGLNDDKNFDYVIANMLNFKEGMDTLQTELPVMSNYNKQAVLKKLQQGRYPEFNDVLITMLSDKNKFLVEMAIDILKKNISSDMSLKPFTDLIESGYSPEGIQGSLEIVSHFVKKNLEDIFLTGLEKQPSHKCKNIILEFMIDKLKKDITASEALTEKILPKLMVFFDNYNKEREELYFSIFKIIATLHFAVSGKVKAVKQKLIGFAKEYDNRLTTVYRNNWSEFVVKLNHMIARLEEAEAKIKNIVVLFDIDATKIDHPRMVKLKEQVAELPVFDGDTRSRFISFLTEMVGNHLIDWKVKSVALDLLGEYGGATELAVLSAAIEKETSLAVKTGAQKALKKIEERHAADIEPVLVMEPLFYLQKILNEFFKSKAYKVYNLAEASRFSDLVDQGFRFVAVSENLLTPEFTQELFDFADEHDECTLVVVTANPDKWSQYAEVPNMKFLKKPFKAESLAELLD